MTQIAKSNTARPAQTSVPARLWHDADLPMFLTADETARLLRTTRKAIYVMLERGLLPGVTRLGRRVLVRRNDLLDWLGQKRAPSPKE